jgi:hypothetical protein
LIFLAVHKVALLTAGLQKRHNSLYKKQRMSQLFRKCLETAKEGKQNWWQNPYI